MNINLILEKMVEEGASDLHLKVGNPPIIRINGTLSPLSGFSEITAEDTFNIAAEVMPQSAKARFKNEKEADFAYGVNKVGRFRINAFLQRGVIGMAFRSIPFVIPEMSKLNIPEVVKSVALENRGLILVTGITGSGKSTTLATMIEHMNNNKHINIITIEDPIEFVYKDKNSIISQREIGSDTNSFAEALKRSMRQDPDVILVGEMRDLETITTAIQAAETGHLVLSTLHTTDTAETINRIISVFPAHQQEQIRVQLAAVLKSVISQRLIPKTDGSGRVAAFEVMVANTTIKECILDRTKTRQITDFIEQGRSVYGSQSFDQSVLDLVRAGYISFDEALKWVKRPDDFALKIRGVASSSEDHEIFGEKLYGSGEGYGDLEDYDYNKAEGDDDLDNEDEIDEDYEIDDEDEVEEDDED